MLGPGYLGGIAAQLLAGAAVQRNDLPVDLTPHQIQLAQTELGASA